MRRKPAAFLWDVREAVLRIQEFVAGRDFEVFSSDVMVRSAVERQFEIIGEALNQLTRSSPTMVAEIPEAARVIAFRNILIHGYAILDHQIVWRVVHDNLPPLLLVVERLLKAEPPSGSVP